MSSRDSGSSALGFRLQVLTRDAQDQLASMLDAERSSPSLQAEGDVCLPDRYRPSTVEACLKKARPACCKKLATA
eukprot:2966410-Rhodomonas_salina.2